MAEISSSDDENSSSSNSLSLIPASNALDENSSKEDSLVPELISINGVEISEQITKSLDKLSTNNHKNSPCKNGDGESDSSEEQIRKKVRVGNHYQARIPKFVPDCKDRRPDEELLWSPFVLDENTVEVFLKKISSLTKLLIPLGNHLRDDEHALYVLQQHDYNVETAFQVLSAASVVDDQKTVWSEEECRNFESGLLNFGKNFYLMQKYKVSTRQIGELVQFYYLWKKTERYDLMASRMRTGKKKYALNPGISDLMCRYLGGQRRNFANLSPDVQFVVDNNKKDVAQNHSQY